MGLRARIAAVLAVWVLLEAAPAPAATTPVAIRDFSFSPRSVTRVMGTTFRWTNQGPSSHTSTYSGALRVWSSGTLRPGSLFSKTLTQAGTYAYRCNIHPYDMTGSIAIPAKVSPSRGTTATTFTITVALANPPSGLVYDVQRRKGTGSWTSLRSGLRSRTTTFRAGSMGRGSYSFRARVRRPSSGAATGWSPPVTVVVS